MKNPITSSRQTRRAVLRATCAITLFTGVSATAQAGTVLYLTTSQYAGKASTVTVGQALPNTNGATAIADGSYPGVFANDSVDGNFGITAPIFLRAFATFQTASNGTRITGPLSTVDITSATGVATSFSSKSELAVHPSTDGTALTFMGYTAPVNMLDVSNANTPDVIDPSNTDTQTPTYRAVVEVDLDANGLPATEFATNTDAYSGNNGRSAILATNADGSGASEYLLAGNAGNGSGTPLTSIVANTGVQTIAPGAASPLTTVIGAQQGTPGSKNGFEYGFSVTSLGDAADKSGKDDNFRGATIYNNTLYVTKGSGGNGVNTVYQVTPANGGLPLAADGPTTQISILPGLPTGLATNIVEGDPATEFFPFDVFFASPTVMYVADEGSQDLNPDPNAGLQKWMFDGTKWNLAYTIQAGLNLDQPYSVANYPAQYNPATTGLRHITGVVSGQTVTIFATTATFSSLADPGADPNQVVRVVDFPNAKTLQPNVAFTQAAKPIATNVYRGVAAVTTP